MQDELNVLNTALWPNTPLGVRRTPLPRFAGNSRPGSTAIEKAWAGDSITETWALESQLRFISWGNCSASCRRGIRDQLAGYWGRRPHGLGTQLDGKVNGMELNTWATGNGDCVHRLERASGVCGRRRCTSSGTRWVSRTSRTEATRRARASPVARRRTPTAASNESCVGGHCVQGTNGNQNNRRLGRGLGVELLQPGSSPTATAGPERHGHRGDALVTLYGHPTPVTAVELGREPRWQRSSADRRTRSTRPTPMTARTGRRSSRRTGS